MPRSNSSAKNQKRHYSAHHHQPKSPVSPLLELTQSRTLAGQLEHGIDVPSPLLPGHVSTVMSDRSKAVGVSMPPLQEPRILAVNSNIPSPGLGGRKTFGGLSPLDRDRPNASENKSGRDGEGKISAPKSTRNFPNQLHQYTEKLTRVMERQGPGKPVRSPGQPTMVLPALEAAATTPPLAAVSGPLTAVTDTSTESSQTIRPAITPGPVAAKTPSYPFPRMTNSSAQVVPPSLHRPFTELSPTETGPHSPPSNAASSATCGASRPQDSFLSNPATPASTVTFQPVGANQLHDDSELPIPNLYEISLMLSSEPGLGAWWRTVVHVLTVFYRAERLTLSVPADSTDLENVPWGQKATYNACQKDNLSMEYMARGSSLIPSSITEMSELASPFADDTTLRPQTPLRPPIHTRRSFTTFEDAKSTSAPTSSKLTSAFQRPGLSSRSKSSYPQTPRLEPSHKLLNQGALAEHDAQHPEPTNEWDPPTPQKENHGMLFEMLQALDYEADPLIDHHGVSKVLDRSRVVVLTRSYPYLDDLAPGNPTEGRPPARSQSPDGHLRKKTKRAPINPPTKLSNILSSAAHPTKARPNSQRGRQNLDQMISEGEPRRPPTPKYEEYEQPPPSPWSQSPAPSPAIRPDPKDNPFFTKAGVDESSFIPTQSTTPDYAVLGPQEAIGVDNAWTVLHIPLTLPFFPKPSAHSKLDSSFRGKKSSVRRKENSSDLEKQHDQAPFRKEKQTPIAILSILSSTIPYPSTLRCSLEQLSSHLATSFSLCRHYSNLEAEVTRMHHRRPRITGFGAVDSEGRPITDPAIIHYASEEVAERSLAGSLTSPSDYSAPSRSVVGTPGGTPGWDAATGFAASLDKRPALSSPTPMAVDSYFTTKTRSTSKTDLSSTTHQQRLRRSSRGSTASEKRSSLRLSGGVFLESGRLSPGVNELEAPEEIVARPSDTPTSIVFARRVTGQDATAERPDDQIVESKGPMRASTATPRRHTKLHSYGGDFATTFQSLPPGSNISTKPVLSQAIPSHTPPPKMATPTNRLKDLILDSLPAQIFVAEATTGGILWVNSRYLAYRGQSLAELQADAYASIHPDDRDIYLKAWGQAVKTGSHFQMVVRIRRFDGAFRCFSARVVPCKNKCNEVVHHLGSYTDIHEQTVAELRVVRQQEIEASEAKYRFLANLIPQIIFTATEAEGITFSNEQWLAYTGQTEEDALGLGFMDHVHPEDLTRCHIPTGHHHPPTPSLGGGGGGGGAKLGTKGHPLGTVAEEFHGQSASTSIGPSEGNVQGVHHPLSRKNSSSSDSVYELPSATLTKLAKEGAIKVIKVGTDSNGRLSYTTEIRLRSKTGEYRWHLVRCVEIANVGNSNISYFGSATDINDHKLLEVKLKEAMESKSRFLSNMSHEIRTPLIGISGMVSFLQDTTLNEEQRDYTNTIQTSANSLLMIINDILDLSKVDAGMMKLNHEWFHTRALIEDVNELVSAMAIARRLELNYLVDEDVPSYVKGDRVRIRQVLLNVIGNAIKFTDTGEVFSRCRVKAGEPGQDEHQVMLEFAVIDTGRGFNEDEARLIFKPFSQIDGSSTRAHGGSGLGLVISRQLVELHGGKMDGTAVPGQGATFTFTAKFGLPTEADHPDVPVSPVAPQATVVSKDVHTQPFRPLPITRTCSSPPAASPSLSEQVSSPAVTSSDSSNPSIHSTGTRVTTRSSVASVHTGLAWFSEAARASGQDLTQMKLEMPVGRNSPAQMPTPEHSAMARDTNDFRPPMFSILIVCPQKYSREATTRHVEMTLPKEIPYQITALPTAQEAAELIGRDDPVIFTHVIINLTSSEEILRLIGEITSSTLLHQTTLVLLSDSIQRQALTKHVEDDSRRDWLSRSNVTWIYKPVKPSRLAVIFDPGRERDNSVDRNRSTAQMIVDTQRKSYEEVAKRMGNKGYKVLLVEDNHVNQKVLKKFLAKVGLEVEIAMDGKECTDKVFAHPHTFYSLILCDLHMPRKDGYQACREIRDWEARNKLEQMPIIALSANVMSDVQEKCVEAGFSEYVTKPVDFIELSTTLSKFF